MAGLTTRDVTLKRLIPLETREALPDRVNTTRLISGLTSEVSLGALVEET